MSEYQDVWYIVDLLEYNYGPTVELIDVEGMARDAQRLGVNISEATPAPQMIALMMANMKRRHDR